MGFYVYWYINDKKEDVVKCRMCFFGMKKIIFFVNEVEEDN